MNVFRLSHLTPVLLGLLIFSSNFLNTELFAFGDPNFAVWFSLSIFCLACGWIINLTLGWTKGGKVIFAVTIATTIISVFLITFFRDYFIISNPITENILLFSLRNVTLGAMGFFGMAVCEILRLQRELISLKNKNTDAEKSVENRILEAELTLKEAKLNAELLLLDAEKKSRELLEKKEKIVRELSEFIQIQKELLKKYEEE